jgi:hypothetical protein
LSRKPVHGLAGGCPECLTIHLAKAKMELKP